MMSIDLTRTRSWGSDGMRTWWIFLAFLIQGYQTGEDGTLVRDWRYSRLRSGTWGKTWPESSSRPPPPMTRPSLWQWTWTWPPRLPDTRSVCNNAVTYEAKLDINVLCWMSLAIEKWQMGVLLFWQQVLTVTSHQKVDDSSSFAPIFIGPSFYGDIWSQLQQTLNFSYHMVSLFHSLSMCRCV